MNSTTPTKKKQRLDTPDTIKIYDTNNGDVKFVQNIALSLGLGQGTNKLSAMLTNRLQDGPIIPNVIRSPSDNVEQFTHAADLFRDSREYRTRKVANVLVEYPAPFELSKVSVTFPSYDA
jgi:hypothetical protein